MKKLFFALLFAAPLAFTSCIPEDDDPGNTTQPGNPYKNENFYFTGSLNSDSTNNTLYYLYPVDFNSQRMYASAASASGRGGLHEQSMVITQPTTSNNSGGVAFLIDHTGPITCPQVEQYIKQGGYPFGNRLKDEEGVVVYFIDNDGREWASDKGLAKQDSSAYFIVTEHVVNTTDNFSKYITMANFECRVYDNSGRSIRIKNGGIRSRSVWCN